MLGIDVFMLGIDVWTRREAGSISSNPAITTLGLSMLSQSGPL
jgi:hypothetical protein